MGFNRLVSCLCAAAIAFTAIPLTADAAAVPASKKELNLVFDPPKPKKFSPDSLPEIELTGGLLFQLIASEIALQRNELGAAYSTYMNVAEETGDPRLAERAVQIAQVAKAPREIMRSVLLWNKLAPGNRHAQEMLIRIGLHYQEYNKILLTTQSFLSQVEDPGKVILGLQSQLSIGKDRKKALTFFRKATEKFKRLPETKLGLARLEGLAGNQKAAEKFAKESYKQKPTPESVMTLVSVLLQKKSNAGQKEARQVLGQYLAKNPKDLRIRDSYAQLLLLSSDYNQLIELVKKYPNDYDFELSTAVSLLQNNHEAEAEALLTKLSKLPQDDAENGTIPQKALLLLSEVALENKKYEEALTLADRVVGSMKPAALIQKANVYSHEDKHKEALEVLKQVDPGDNSAVAEEVAAVESRLIAELNGDTEALKTLEKYLQKYPESKSLFYEAAMIAERLDLISMAENYLKRALEIDPNFANAYNSLGYTLLERTNRLKEAGENIRKAYQLDPSNPYILDSMGWLSFKEKNYTEAIGYLNDALQLLESEDIMLHLAEAYWVSNQKDEARLVLKRAKELWPDSEDTEALIKRLGIRE
ncbi:tetratricopeptide repeat protein [Turicimonas muris]|uniref:tetratricopeptide repeat protein n=1 Tax=Turicimonas muris TaxID=1796652 RepID=UPI0024954DC3|nr:tetratricopeptide repeat protein [Turicimonas muris]